MRRVKGEPEFVRALARGLTIIETFGEDGRTHTLSTLSEKTNLNAATVRRLLHTLCELGYVVREGRNFRLAPRALKLGYAYLAGQPWWQVAQPILEEASETLHETCGAGVLDGMEVVHVLRVHASAIRKVDVPVGSRFPAVATALGRVILAHLPQEERDRRVAESPLRSFTSHSVTEPAEFHRVLKKVKEQGYAYVDQEFEEGLRSVAVPVFDRKGAVIAAINVTPFGRTPRRKKDVEALAEPLFIASRRITESLA